MTSFYLKTLKNRMSSIETLTEFFGWLSIINIGILLLSSLAIFVLKGWALKIHSRMFNLEDKVLEKAYFTYLAHYKIATSIFCITPYLVLKIIA